MKNTKQTTKAAPANSGRFAIPTSGHHVTGQPYGTQAGREREESRMVGTAPVQPGGTRPELTFDGCGINGPDEYRSRLCTFREDSRANAAKYGTLFAAAPALLAALEGIESQPSLAGLHDSLHGPTVRQIARAAIALAKGGDK